MTKASSERGWLVRRNDFGIQPLQTLLYVVEKCGDRVARLLAPYLR